MELSYFAIIVGAIFVNNVVLAQFLGICPFLGVSSKVETSLGMGAAVTFVMALTSVVAWSIQTYVLVPLGIEYMQTIVFILVIAALVQMVEIMLKKVSPSLYQALGIFLPLITTNCAVLGVAILMISKEFNLLQAALNIEEDMDNLRYNKVVIATDADVDGMHIRLLLMTFFLQFFPDVIRGGHLYVLQTPLFRVRNKKETHYCYSEEEKNRAVARCGANAEITRFKGLGEISPDEFRGFIGQDIRLDKVRLTKDDPIHDMLEFYMGKNTYERQGFIIGNLRIEEDIVESDLAIG